MQGHLGQYVFVLPEENIIIVRLGNSKGKSAKEDRYMYINEGLKILEKSY